MPHWITEPLAEKIRQLFEPKYGHALTDEEVQFIADNLTELIELLIKHKMKLGYN